MAIDRAQLTQRLLEERALLEQELGSVGRINPENRGDWETTAAGPNEDTAELESRAAEITDFEDRNAIEFELEKRFTEINTALERINDGSYGTCTICGKQIEEDRLNANPAALTCIEHRG